MRERLKKIWQLLRCRWGYHDLVYHDPPPGVFGGIFGPCHCRACGYRHPGFPKPLR